MTGCLVKRVIFQCVYDASETPSINTYLFSVRGDTAVGIEYTLDSTLHPGAPSDAILATAKLVVLSAGAFGTPAILERSGVGSGALHKQLGIQNVVDLPGVGENYQGEHFPRVKVYSFQQCVLDHCAVFPGYFASDDSDTLDGIVRNDEKEIDSNKYSLAFVTPLLTSTLMYRVDRAMAS